MRLSDKALGYVCDATEISARFGRIVGAISIVGQARIGNYGWAAVQLIPTLGCWAMLRFVYRLRARMGV